MVILSVPHKGPGSQTQDLGLGGQPVPTEPSHQPKVPFLNDSVFLLASFLPSSPSSFYFEKEQAEVGEGTDC